METRRYRSLEERLKLYEVALNLRRRGFGYKRISRIIKETYGEKLNPGMICNWVNNRYHPLGRNNKLVPGSSLAYVIGGWLGDGSLNIDKKRGKHMILLKVKDYEFAEEWGKCLATALGRSRPCLPAREKDGRWRVKCSSKLLYRLLEESVENPRILMPFLEPYPADACRGFFDAEGTVDRDFYRIKVGVTRKALIDMFGKLLRELSIDFRIHKWPQRRYFKSPRSSRTYRRKELVMYCLAIYGRENVLKFANHIGFTIFRKQAALKRLLERYRL